MHKPLITVAPSSKLMSRPTRHIPPSDIIDTSPSPKPGRKRRLRLCGDSISAATDQHHGAKTIHNNNAGAAAGKLPPQQEPQITKDFMQMHKSNGPHHHYLPPPPNLYPIRHGMSELPRFMHSSVVRPPCPPPHSSPIPSIPPSKQQHRPPPHAQAPPQQNQHAQQSAEQPTTSIFGATQPPITILVPYPIILPVPVPIPIPMPIEAFLRAALLKLDQQNNVNNSSQMNNANNNNEAMPVDEPLDCTKSKESVVPPKDTTPKKTKDEEDEMEEIKLASEMDAVVRRNMNVEKRNTTKSRSCSYTTSTSTPLNNNSNTNNKNDNSKETITADKTTTIDELHERVPKLKITRLHSKRIITTTASTSARSVSPVTAAAVSNSTSNDALEIRRPLRKRKRIIDCDYLKLKDDDNKRK